MTTLSNATILECYTAAAKGIGKQLAKMGKHLNPDAIADMTQTVMVRVLESFDPERGTAPALAYFIGQNLAKDFSYGKTSAGGSKEAQLAESDDEDGTSTTFEVADEGPSALAQMVANESSDEIARAMSELKDHERAALHADLASERALTGSERIAKMRAIKKIQAALAA